MLSHFRWLTAGESHGPELVALVEGCPAGLPLLAEHINDPLARRQRGYGRGGRMKIEKDTVQIMTGVRGGETLGSPIALVVTNRDYANWEGRMGPAPFASPPEALTRPRPGHADLAGGLKYDRHDLRDILERASARETAARVAVGALAQRLLQEVGISVLGHVISIGTIEAPAVTLSVTERRARVLASEFACASPEVEAAMKQSIHETSHLGDTLGGVVEVIVDGVPPGLGSHVQWDRKLDGRLAQALMSIQAFKGVEIGLGFEASRRRGSQVHDPIDYEPSSHGFPRGSNGAGGLEGGISNGMPIVCRGAMKPIATLKKALRSVNITSKEREDAAFERSDICAVPAASVVAEAMVAIVIADALLEKTGGDSLGEVKRNLTAFVDHLRTY